MTFQKKKTTGVDIQKIDADQVKDQNHNSLQEENNSDLKKAVSENTDDTDADSTDDIQALREKLRAKEEQVKEYYDRYLRLAAEFDNYKKRSAREKDEYRKFANESLIQELLAVADNLERAIQSIKDDGTVNNLVLEGVHMTLNEILRVFEKFKVKPIDALGEPFDPTFHQAVMQEETELQPENIVLNELQKGYMIHDRLLRPSMVVVSKSATKDNDS
jgi:molecular chaperone GrpE